MNTDARAARRRPGRPKSKVTRETVIAVARELFLEFGPDVPIETIAIRAGISKPLLYRQFRDKDALVEAVLRIEARRSISPQRARRQAAMELAEGLVAFGMDYVELAFDQLRGWGPLIVSMLPRHPDLARRFFETGPAKDHAHLIALIAEGAVRGLLVVDDPVEAAGDLLGIWLGIPGMEVTLRSRAPLSKEEIARRVEQGVKRFLRFYAARRPPAD